MRILVLPAASKPSINIRISFDPKILLIIFDTEPPISSESYGNARRSGIFLSMYSVKRSRKIVV